jgi:hypothetical protein
MVPNENRLDGHSVNQTVFLFQIMVTTLVDKKS